MTNKITTKYKNIKLNNKKKIEICKIYFYYKNILSLLKLSDECKFLNLSLLFFKKISIYPISKEQISKKLSDPAVLYKLNNFPPTKFTKWLIGY